MFIFYVMIGAGSPKPNRKYFNAVQSNELENFDRLNLSEREVKVWFQNRLMEENRENTTSSTANAPKTDQPYSPSQSLSSDVSSLTSHQSPPAEEDQQHSPPQSISSGVSPATSHRSHLFEDVESYLEQILERFLEQFIEFTGLDNYRLTTIDCGIPSAQAAPADYPEDTTLEDEEFDSTTHQFEYIRGLLFENYQDPMDLLNDVGNDWPLCPQDEVENDLFNL